MHFTAPASAGGAPITGYIVTVFAGGAPYTGATFNSTAVTVTVKGLTKGGHFTFEVAARNARGRGAESALSNVITPT